jgi:CheY-like chemotaxis protein
MAEQPPLSDTGEVLTAIRGTKAVDLNVLVVDDDPAVRTMMKIAFSIAEGVGEVREAASGREVIDLCSTFEPDLVMLDYWMPEMDGEQVAAWLRNARPLARIVAFSGVLGKKPDWADDICVKGRMPDLDVVIDLTRRERGE